LKRMYVYLLHVEIVCLYCHSFICFNPHQSSDQFNDKIESITVSCSSSAALSIIRLVLTILHRYLGID